MKKNIWLIVRTAISIGLMAVLLYMMRDSIPKMLMAVKNIPIALIAAAYAIFALSIVIMSFRLKLLLATKNIFLRFPDFVRLTYIGYFFSSFLPTAVGGDVVKAFYVSQASGSAVSSYTTIFMDRFLGMCSLFTLVIAGLICSKNIPNFGLNWLMPVILLVCAAMFAFFFNKRFANFSTRIFTPLIPVKVAEKIKKIYAAVHGFKKHKPRLFQCLLISMTGQAVAFTSAYVIALGLSATVPFKAILLAMPIASMASMIPSIYGTGPREMSMVIILSPFAGDDKALAIALLWLGLLLTSAFIGGIIHLAMGSDKLKTTGLNENGKGT